MSFSVLKMPGCVLALMLGSFLVLATNQADAQFATGKVVASCGGQSLIPGQSWPFTIDTAGNPCATTSGPLPAGAATATNQTVVQSAPGTPQTTALTIQGNSSGVAVPVSGAVGINQTTPGTTNAVTTAGFPLANTVVPFAVLATSTSVTGLTLPGKVRFQASPVSTLGSATASIVSIQVSYTGGNACTAPNVILGPGQIDDWVYISGATAPTACAATTGGTLLAVQ